MHIIHDEDPSDPRIFIPNVEFYITNVCNLNCKNCNRFNDRNFSGTQRWQDYADIYTRWAEKVRLQKVTILGGEPLLNPTILEWIDGINHLWKKRVQILTNGTHLNRVPGLYDRLLTSPDANAHWVKNYIGVSLHNINDRERCFDEIKKFLHGEVKYHHVNDPDNIDNCKTQGATHAFSDSNSVTIPVWEYDDFYQAAVHTNSSGKLTLYNHTPEQSLLAHKYCGFAMFKCYHFIRGKLYKCGPVALFPEFDQQFKLDISDDDRMLINSYPALSIDEFDQRGQSFISNLDKPIPQCKFCPVEQWNDRLMATNKKPGSISGFIK